MWFDSSFVHAWLAVSAYGMLGVGILMASAPVGYLGLRNRIVQVWRPEIWRPSPAFQKQCRIIGVLIVVLGLSILRVLG
jgi:hypothetical protein